MPFFRFDGTEVPFQERDTVASALHRAGFKVLSRSLKYHRPRGLYCNMGNCAGCMVGIDGVPNVLACMEPAKAGIDVRSQNRLGSAAHDLYGVVDKVFPRGFDPHNMFTEPRWLNEAFLKAVRTMSGVGKVPKREATGPPATFRRMRIDELVVGGGAQGLRRAKQAAKYGRSILLVDENARLGGSARWNLFEAETRILALEAPTWKGVEAWTESVCFGLYRDPDLRRALTAGIHRKKPDGTHELVQVAARRITVAPGVYDAWPLFANNDLPGVMTLRGAQRLWGEHGLLPGRHLVAHGKVPRILQAAWENAGAQLVAQGRVESAHGATHVEGAVVDGQHVECDAVITVGRGQPRNELFQQAGCRFGARADVLAPLCDGHGATTHPQVYAAFSPEAKPW